MQRSWKSLSEQSQKSCVPAGWDFRKVWGDLSVCLPSPHSLSREGALCPACGCWVLHWPGRPQVRAHLHPTALSHQPKPQPALNPNHCCVFWDSILSTSVSYAGRGQNDIESSLESKSCLQCLLTFRVFSCKQAPQIPSSKNNAT